jgi:predicted DNA-binding protein
MRTSIILEDELGERLRAAAREQGMSLSRFLAEAGKARLGARPLETPPFELIVEGGAGVRDGLSLDQTSALWAAEDESTYGS